MESPNSIVPPPLVLNYSEDDLTCFKDCDIILLKKLLKCEKTARMLAEEVSLLSFDYGVNDLHSLAQTEDLALLQDSLPPLTSNFVKLMLSQVRGVLEQLFHVNTKQYITITASKYTKGDYLLCHDDLCGDRHIAFVYYLSENWTEADGGALRFFNLDHNTKEPVNDEYRQVLVPVFNSLVAFRVTDTSYHEVEQVLCDKSRLSINGWFHCDKARNKKQSDDFLKSTIYQFDQYNKENDLSGVVRKLYLTRTVRQDLATTLQHKPALTVNNFIEKEIYDACLLELKSDLSWTMVGPANHRKYEVLKVEVEQNQIGLPETLPHLKRLLQSLVSPHWLNYLNKITNMEFAVFSAKCVPPTCMIEVQRWKEGYYSLLADDDFQKKVPTLDVTIFFGVDSEMLGHETSSLDDPAEINGHIVYSMKSNNSPSHYRVLARIKKQKLESELQDFGVKPTTWRFRSKTAQLDNSRRHLKSNYISRSYNRRIKNLVKKKISRMMEYRNTFVISENNVVLPTNNMLLLSMNCDSTSKFSSLIKRSGTRSVPKTCYYAVTISYLTTSCFHDRHIDSVIIR